MRKIKDRDSCFIDPFFIPKVFDPVSISLIDRIDPLKVFNPISVPSFESVSPKLSIEPTLENKMIGKVYSRKKVAVFRLIQVQESESTFGNEVIVFHPPLQTELELQSKILNRPKPTYYHREGNEGMH